MRLKYVQSLAIVAAAVGILGGGSALAKGTSPQRMPYTTVDHPQFVPASEATFMSAGDVLIGVSSGDVAKAYPAALLAQHGVVQDQMADGPIAITW
ncbi:MAG: DUF3179 domain-containing protein [Acidobacteriia bacterium]|nr:DUF3179 domain-containing protein [Terriglobia bacterium]